MIKRPTVLVLGAGASEPYGFPLGRALRDQIIDGATKGNVLHNALIAANFDESQILLFRNSLEKSGKISVDAFLEHRSDLIPVGKAAIAGILIRCENDQTLVRPPNRDDHWYEHLFNKLNAKPDAFSKNQLSVITFNYDRSLEHYLFIALQNSYGLADNDAAALLKCIPVIHLHGQLGKLPYLSEHGSRNYVPKVEPSSIRLSAQQIQIIHEDNIDGAPQFEQAHKLLENAEAVCVLGFGYDPTNISRLKLAEIAQQAANLGKGKILMGSALGLTDMEAQSVKSIFRSGIELGYRGWSALSYLREKTPFDR